MTIRDWSDEDSVEELTALLHRAYKELADAGLNFTAAYQDEAQTCSRLASGHAFVAEEEGRIVGTIVVATAAQGSTHPAYYQRRGVHYFHQLGVDPQYRRQGVGAALIAAAEAFAHSEGATEMGLDTAEPADWLVARYESLGYRIVGRHQWIGKTYGSLVMAKSLMAR